MRASFIIIVFISLLVKQGLAQIEARLVIHISKIAGDGLLLDSGWKYKAGDDPEWAKLNYNDSSWKSIDPTLHTKYYQKILGKEICWLRLTVSLDSAVQSFPLVLRIQQNVASEIYLDGKLVTTYGVVSHNSREVKAFNPLNQPLLLNINPSREHVLAVRICLPLFTSRYDYFELKDNFFSARICEGNQSLQKVYHSFYSGFGGDVLKGAVFGILFLLHVGFFLIYSSQKANLYFALFNFFIASTYFIHAALIYKIHDVQVSNLLKIPGIAFLPLSYWFLLRAVYNLLEYKKGNIYWLLSAMLLFILISSFVATHGQFEFLANIQIFFFPMIINIECFRISLILLKKQQRGAGVIVVGSVGFIVFSLLAMLVMMQYKTYVSLSETATLLFDVLYNASILILPVSVCVFLALEFGFTHRSLQQKLIEVKDLSRKNLEQEKERQRILATQNELLEQQVTERTAELKHSLEELKATQAQLIQQEKMASLGQLTAGIAHEIQNPLNFVNNFSEVNKELVDELEEEVNKGNLDEVKAIAKDIKDNEQKIIHHGKRADAIVKGMLQHSRLSTGQKELTDINAFVDEYLRLSYHGFRAKDKNFNATIKTDFDVTMEKINIVPQDIGRVLLNLFNNAFYAIAEKKKKIGDGYEPKVTVTTKRINSPSGNDGIEIRVEDNGAGIPQKIVDKIFQPFFTTKPTGEGTGLGLSLAYDIIKAHGGEIKVVSKEGEGAEFVIEVYDK